MKLGKLLTVTALATGVTIGGFVDSAEAIRRTGGVFSNTLELLEFTIDDMDSNNENIEGISKDGGYSYEEAVSEIIFNFNEINGNKLEPIEDHFVDITNVTLDTFDDDPLKTDILKFQFSNISFDFDDIVATIVDNSERNPVEVIPLEDADVDVFFEYEITGDSNQLDISDLNSIFDFINNPENAKLNVDNSFVEYDNNLANFLNNVVGFTLQNGRDDLVGENLLGNVDDDDDNNDTRFDVTNEEPETLPPEQSTTTVPESNTTFSLIALGAIGMFLSRRRSIRSN